MAPRLGARCDTDLTKGAANVLSRRGRATEGTRDASYSTLPNTSAEPRRQRTARVFGPCRCTGGIRANPAFRRRWMGTRRRDEPVRRTRPSRSRTHRRGDPDPLLRRHNRRGPFRDDHHDRRRRGRGRHCRRGRHSRSARTGPPRRHQGQRDRKQRGAQHRTRRNRTRRNRTRRNRTRRNRTRRNRTRRNRTRRNRTRRNRTRGRAHRDDW